MIMLNTFEDSHVRHLKKNIYIWHAVLIFN